MSFLTESTVENAVLAWLEEFGYAVLHGPEIEPERPQEDRVSSRRDAILSSGVL